MPSIQSDRNVKKKTKQNILFSKNVQFLQQMSVIVIIILVVIYRRLFLYLSMCN